MKRMKLLLLLLSLVISASFSYAKKKQDANYIARRTAAIQEMDSLLRYSGEMPHVLMELADMKCKEFKRDPVLMRAIASSFATNAGLIENSKARYQEIKKRYPKDFESYSDYAATCFDYSIKVNPNSSLTRDQEWFNLAKAQIDSAKVMFPQSKAPYLWWMNRCVRYAYNDFLVNSFREEVEAYKKAFPNEDANYVAAKIMGDSRIEMNMLNFETISAPESNTFDKLRSDAEYSRRVLAHEYFDKVDISGLSADDLCELAYFYYQSTESKYLGRDERALLHEKGLECAKLGAEKFPDYTNFSRFQLWHAAELSKTYDVRITQARRNKTTELQAEETAKWDANLVQGSSGADKLISQTDTLLRQDYYFAGVVKQFQGKYKEAIDLYKKAVGPMLYIESKLPYKSLYHDCDSLTIYQNISDCYDCLKEYEKAIGQLTALFDLRKQHGGQLKRLDYLDLIKLYRQLGNDTAKTQQDRFAAYVAIDSLLAEVQDSIDAGNDLFTMPEGFSGMYLMQRMVTRTSMDRLTDYAERDNYLPVEIAEEIVRRIEPLPQKSENEINWVGVAFGVLWREYYKNKDYKNALKYIDLELKYDPDKKEMYGRTIEYLTKLAKKQR